MYLGGRGGTGKSTVIKAVHVLHKELGIQHALRLTAFTGTAASAIDGSTISSLAELRNSNSTSLKSLETKWENVDTLIADETSMIGCRTLKKLNQNLNVARHSISTDTFGGLDTVVFAGKSYILTNKCGIM